ncbi:K(+)-transporting ATPase subunit F [Prescottella agglutinans]
MPTPGAAPSNTVGLVLVVCLAVYLAAALLFPERF